MKTLEIIATGNELIQGEIANTNASYISRELVRRGIDVLYHTTVGDDVVLLGAAIERALDRVDLVIITGGLGPTRDDITREAVGLACQKKLVLDNKALNQIQNFFHCRHRQMPESNLRQAMLPEEAILIPNKIGTAPGFNLLCRGKELFCLPGVPEEMKRMFKEWVTLRLEALIPKKRYTLSKKLHVFGLPEALIGEKIVHLMTPESNPRVGTMVHEGIITLRLHADAEEEARAKSMLEGAEMEIRQLLKDAVFGTDEEELEDVVGSLLIRNGLTIAIAESCTGGLVCNLLTNVSGISKHLLEGIVVYTVKAKALLTGLSEESIEKMGTVNPEITKLLAASVRERTSADIGMAVTGIAGPTSPHSDMPIGLVYIALATSTKATVAGKECPPEQCRNRSSDLSMDRPKGLSPQKDSSAMGESGHTTDTNYIVNEFYFTGTRKWIKLLAAKNALNMVRLHLLKAF